MLKVRPMIENSLLLSAMILLAAWLVDQFYGEYPNRLHPVVWMGTVTHFILRFLPRRQSLQLIWGLLLATGLPILFATLSYGLLLSTKFWPAVYFLLSVFLLKSSFALKALGDAAFQVLGQLQINQLDQARQALSALCSRDPSKLSKDEILNASIASIAENLCDSVIAPLFYYMLFGIPGAIAYRTVNTLDAMIGYRDERRYVGAASARLDDILNWIPARLSALLLLASAMILRYPVSRAWAIAWRDHDKTPSPNGGWSMATMAGILGLQISKPGIYQLGDARGPSHEQDLLASWTLAQISSLLFTLLVMLGLILTTGE